MMSIAYMEQPVKSKKKFKVGTAAIYVFLVLWAITTIFPFVWVILNSFKESSEVLNSSFALPKVFTMMNYENAFTRMKVLSCLLYTSDAADD